MWIKAVADLGCPGLTRLIDAAISSAPGLVQRTQSHRIPTRT